MTSATSLLVLVANAGDSTVTAFSFDPDTSEPTLVRLSSSAVGKGCSTFAVDTHRDLVYAGSKGERQGVDVFRLDRATGGLTPAGHAPTDGSMTYLELARSGSVLLGASYGGGYAATFLVDGDGGIGPESSRVDWPNAHCVVAADEGRQAYVVSLGADVIAQYDVSPDGTLTPLDPAIAHAPDGSGPRHLVFDDDESHAYVVTEFSGEVLTYVRDGESGTLSADGAAPAFAPDRGLHHSTLGADPVAGHLIWGADVHLARDGALILATERTESTLAALRVDRDGQVGGIECLIETEPQPRGFAVTPDGTHAIVAGEGSTQIALVRIAEDGTLRTVSRHETGRGANWVRVVPA